MPRHTVAAALAFTLAASAAGAQQASPWLPPGHWTQPLLVRLHALGGVAGDPVPTEWTLLQAAAAVGPPYRARLAAERAATPPSTAPVRVPPRLLLEVGLQGSGRAGVVRPGGFTLDREWTGPTPLPDAVHTALALRLESTPFPRLSATIDASAGPDSAAVDHATVDVALGAAHLWAGRRRAGYAPGDGGGLVLTRLDRLDGAGVRTARPLSLRMLGALSAEAFAGPLGRNGHVERAWILGTRVHARPHPRFDAGATRVAVFGGLDGARLGPRQLLEVLVGANLAGDYADDQVASADARWRPPTPVPLELYGEWAMHDIDFGVLVDMPTFTVGVRLPRLAGPAAAAGGPAGSLGASLEHTRISGACCGNPPWYHHFELADGWTRHGALLGHPLGGHGHQWRLGVAGDAGGGALVARTAALVRSRGAENLFAPDREGRAVGFELGVDARTRARAGVSLRLAAERGEGWSDISGGVVARVRF